MECPQGQFQLVDPQKRWNPPVLFGSPRHHSLGAGGCRGRELGVMAVGICPSCPPSKVW